MNNCFHSARLTVLCLLPVQIMFFAGCTTSRTSTSLIDAAYHNQLESAKNIIDAGADINQRGSRGYTSLMLATYYNYYSMVEYLLQQGADVNEQSNDGSTALIIATCNRNIRLVKTLLKYNPDLTIKDKTDQTAMAHARNLNLKIITEILENHGASSDQQEGSS